MQKHEVAPAFLSTAQAAELLGVHPFSLARWRMQGEGPPFVKLGSRMVRYSLEAVTAWAKNNTRTSTAA